MKALRSYLLTGLVVWLPIVVTFVVLRFIVDILDNTIALLPHAYQPEQLVGMRIPGLGVIISLALLIATGVLATNLLGQRLVSLGESLLARIPLVRSIYNTVKQVIQTVFASNSQAFRKVLLVEYPRKGLWSLAFMMGANGAFDQVGEELLSIFIPTTPNPTSGFLMMIPKRDVIEISMTVDEALKFIISLGVMQPAPSAIAEIKTNS